LGGIVVIHNPFARANIRRPWLMNKLRNILEGCGELVLTRNINQVPEVARQCLEKGIDYLAVNGGDGSLHVALSYFINIYQGQKLPAVIPLRGGTMNTMAHSVKLKGDPVSILTKVVRNYRAGAPIPTIKQHLVRLNDQYGFMSGAGIPPNFLAAYYSGTTTGPWQGFKTLAHTVASIIVQGPFYKFITAPAHCKVRIGDEELSPRYYTAILACSIREIGLGFTPTPRAYDKPGCFQFIAATIQPLEIVYRLGHLWLGKDIIHPNLFSRVTDRAYIEPLSNMRYMIDGEIYETEKPIELGCGPTIDMVKMDN